MRDIGNSIPEVALQSMFTALLPAVPGLEDVCKLVADGHVNHAGWTHHIHPSTSNLREPQAFEKLIDIFNIIHASRHISYKKTVNLTMSGDTSPLSSRENTSRPDGFGSAILPPSGSISRDPDDWFSICWALEVKKVDKEANRFDDFQKIIWSLHHIMRNDARRRFAFGLTIEDTTVRLWHHDRDTLVCSTQFDLHANLKELVHVLLELGSASHTDMGFDETIQLSVTYEIDVLDETGSMRTFVTISVLTDHGTNAVFGRATRVWKVFEKDCWVQPDCRLEHVSLAGIRTQLKDDPRLKHFLTVITAGVVLAPTVDEAKKVMVKPDNTKEVIRREQELSVVRLMPIKATATTQRPDTGSSKTTPRTGVLKSVGGVPDAHPGIQKGFRKNENPDDHQRCHYRIVFAEIGKAVVSMSSYKDMFLAVEGALTGISAMHDAGYLHRDGSAGNALLVDRGSGPVGVIIDLEYAINFLDESSPHDTRTRFYPSKLRRNTTTTSICKRRPLSEGQGSIYCFAKMVSTILSNFGGFAYGFYSTWSRARRTISRLSFAASYQGLFDTTGHSLCVPQCGQILWLSKTRSPNFRELASL
ncbi:hypothetical protein BDP27DRAFT_1333427 [Rhodocollybia butyracea]|uniref:Fungal-type protein kinase domain-containing protein n=1 Tax=Rhodocollybia butyracea TaxID=206335 RepID=A0A9P5U2E1_9AGAR|nr:hypothetical protein BDP27DRAFT_1333427 [Rhodocollybia butyracea]